MRKILWIAVAGLLASPAIGQVSLVNANPAPKKGDPDKIVCEVEDQIGTRLARRKVCMTVREWAEERRLNQEAVESIQAKAPTIDSMDPQ